MEVIFHISAFACSPDNNTGVGDYIKARFLSAVLSFCAKIRLFEFYFLK